MSVRNESEAPLSDLPYRMLWREKRTTRLCTWIDSLFLDERDEALYHLFLLSSITAAVPYSLSLLYDLFARRACIF